MKLQNKQLFVLALFLNLICYQPLSGLAQSNNNSALEQGTNNPENKSAPAIAGAATCNSGCCCGEFTTPAGIMTAHIHAKKEWMVAYEYMNMSMKGDRMGTSTRSADDLYKQYLMSPQKMTMQMHMVMVMYGVTDRLSLMGMGGYVTNDMTMTADQPLSCCPPGSNVMKCGADGIADTRLYALYSIAAKTNSQLNGSLGVSAPTGSINANGVTVLGNNERLSYDMQPGTGSWALLPAITYLHNLKSFSLGAEAGGDIKLNKNANGYKTGNAGHLNIWAGHALLPFLTGTLRGEFVAMDKITGADPAINYPYNLRGDPTADATNSGGKWSTLYAGLTFNFKKPVLQKFRLQVEYGIPLYQNLNGTQMAAYGNFMAMLQYKF